MKNEIVYARLWLSELIGLNNDTTTIIKNYNLSNVGFDAKLGELRGTLKPLSDVYAIEKASKLSKDIEIADIRRDKAMTGIKNVAGAYMNHYAVAMTNNADVILRCINKYGDNIVNQSYPVESEILRQLVEDFANISQVKAALTALNLNPWVAELKAANDAFGNLYLQRNTESTDKKQVVKTKDLRKENITKYKAVVQYLEALQTLSPTENQKKLLAEIEMLHSKYDRLVQSHGSKDDAEVTSASIQPAK